MLKKVLKHSAAAVICTIASFFLFYYIFDDYMFRITSPSLFFCLSERLIFAYLLYILAVFLMYRKINRFHIDIFAVMYFILIIGLSLFRSYHFYGINLNPLSITDDFRSYHSFTLLLIIANIFVYLPMGIYIKYRTRLKNIKAVIFFLVYILLIESLQYIFHKGVFDINDIITNTLGFYLGMVIYSFIKNIAHRRECTPQNIEM